MTTTRIALAFCLIVLSVTSAARETDIVSSAKLIAIVQPKLANQSAAIANDLKTLAPPATAEDTVAAAVKKWEDSFRSAAKTKLEEADKEILATLPVGDSDTQVRVLTAASQIRTNVDLELTRSFNARHDALLKSERSHLTAALTKATTEIVDTEIVHGLAARETALLTSLIETGASATQSTLDAQRAAGEKAFLDQFTKQKGISKVVSCLLSGIDTGAPALTCSPDGLVLGGMSIAHVRISGLPVNRAVKVRAQLTEPGSKVACGKQSDESCDFVTLQNLGPSATGTRDATILVHTARGVKPTYEARGDKTSEDSLARLRVGVIDRELQLIARGVGSELGVHITIEGHAPITKARAIPVAFERWRFETGTMFAISNVVDEEIITRPSQTAGKVDVLDRRSADRIRPETVLYLNLVPANYEIFGIGFGLQTSPDRNVSYYLGGSVRLLALSERALASFSGGLTGAQARRFPGLGFKKPGLTAKDPGDPALQGTLTYQTGWYLGISLGFRFGSVGSDPDTQ